MIYRNLGLPGWLQFHQYEYDMLIYHRAQEMSAMLMLILPIAPVVLAGNIIITKSNEIFERIKEVDIQSEVEK